ncbi:MAG: hypothetical protein M1814_002057 [Vezdaea aestivalis]|nr:MAG: hypothetical protein M1814_002057 [Vezdaea aestivalis]
MPTPRSIPPDSESVTPTTDTQPTAQSYSSRPADRSPSRSMKIASLLNNDDDEDDRGRRCSYPSPQSYSQSLPPTRSYFGWAPNNVPSPSDGTASFIDGPDYHDFGSPSESRENRPAYLIEEDTFIWYHRDDRGMKWDEVSAAFNEYFPRDRQRHGLQGIQGRYYRILKDEGVPKLRSRQKKRPRRDYGVIARTSRRYPWMTQN